jgi:hypothetical protein
MSRRDSVLSMLRMLSTCESPARLTCWNSKHMLTACRTVATKSRLQLLCTCPEGLLKGMLPL